MTEVIFKAQMYGKCRVFSIWHEMSHTQVQQHQTAKSMYSIIIIPNRVSGVNSVLLHQNLLHKEQDYYHSYVVNIEMCLFINEEKFFYAIVYFVWAVIDKKLMDTQYFKSYSMWVLLSEWQLMGLFWLQQQHVIWTVICFQLKEAIKLTLDKLNHVFFLWSFLIINVFDVL